jgi:hypothetical protein
MTTTRRADSNDVAPFRVECFEYPSQYHLLGRVERDGSLAVCQPMEEYERILATAWNLQDRALARLFLEIARLRQSAQESAEQPRADRNDVAQ